jgi:hypothetical protein
MIYFINILKFKTSTWFITHLDRFYDSKDLCREDFFLNPSPPMKSLHQCVAWNSLSSDLRRIFKIRIFRMLYIFYYWAPSTMIYSSFNFVYCIAKNSGMAVPMSNKMKISTTHLTFNAMEKIILLLLNLFCTNIIMGMQKSL